jgi:hypothetical protein
MPELTIDERTVCVPEGTTLLQAAQQLGIDIPRMCHQDGYPAFTSCMICVVRDTKSGRLLPACSAAANEGMQVDTCGPLVHQARKDTLELLLSEHVGNCEGPCRRACPADFDIPRNIARIEDGEHDAFLTQLHQHLVFPSLTERVCVAPCESVCRRGEHDAPVSIRQLVLSVADRDLREGSPSLPTPQPLRGKLVAIIGAGPTGLATAYHLQLLGYSCTIFDENEKLGGAVRIHSPVPAEILDAEFAKVERLGAEFHLGKRINAAEIATLVEEFDALVLALGKVKPEQPAEFGLAGSSYGITRQPSSMQTSNPKIFSGGDAVRPFRLVARSVADGRLIARNVHQFLSGEPVLAGKRRFNSRVGSLQPQELERFVAGYSPAPRSEPFDAAVEAERCLHCECRKPDSCKLRNYSDEYGAAQDAYFERDRKPYSRVLSHPEIVFEPGKCIKCGLCVRIAEAKGEPLGLAFCNRGIDIRVGVPFDESLAAGLTSMPQESVEACPTAALACKSPQQRRIGS